MSTYTCINCNVKFADSDIQREHYKSSWHRYNLKRRVATLPPISAEEFQNKIIQQKIQEQAEPISLYCNACRKAFSTEKAHENHLNSKKHKENLILFEKENKGAEKEVTVKNVGQVPKYKATNSITENEIDMEDDIDSDEWEDVAANPIAENGCIFCDHISEDFESNLEHMSIAHSFFIPDPEYCIDLEGLLFYLGEKVARDFICLWCNDRGKTFYSLDSVRKHMKDKGHCKMLHEGIALAEYTEFYDYSSTYPDHVEGMDIDEEFEPPILEGDEYQLVLPSGAVIGHRSLLRYYKQHLNPNRAVTIHKNDKKLHKVLSQYRALGWNKTEQEQAARKAKDIHSMKRLQAKWSMQLGCKANKLQKHFRAQIL